MDQAGITELHPPPLLTHSAPTLTRNLLQVGSAKRFDLLRGDKAKCKVDVSVRKEGSQGISVHLNKLNLRLEV